MPAARPSRAADETAAPQLRQQMVEVCLRDTAPSRDIRTLHGAFALMHGKVNQRDISIAQLQLFMAPGPGRRFRDPEEKVNPDP